MKYLIEVWHRQDKKALMREFLAICAWFAAIWFTLLLVTVA